MASSRRSYLTSIGAGVATISAGCSSRVSTQKYRVAILTVRNRSNATRTITVQLRHHGQSANNPAYQKSLKVKPFHVPKDSTEAKKPSTQGEITVTSGFPTKLADYIVAAKTNAMNEWQTVTLSKILQTGCAGISVVASQSGNVSIYSASLHENRCSNN